MNTTCAALAIWCATGSCDVSCPAPPDTKSTVSGSLACVDKNSDAQACGGCATHCAKGQKCTAGSCTTDACAPGLVNCGSGCVNVKTNVSFCGACGSGHA